MERCAMPHGTFIQLKVKIIGVLDTAQQDVAYLHQGNQVLLHRSDTGLRTMKNMPKGHATRSYGTPSDWSCLDTNAHLLFFNSGCTWNGKYGEGLSEKYALQKIGVKPTKDSGT